MRLVAFAVFCLVALIAQGAARTPVISHRIPTPPGVKILWNVPLHRQSVNYSCGAAAMKSALAYYGVELTEEEIMREVGTTPSNGTEMEPMAALAVKHGIKAESKTGLTLADLERQAAAGQLTIVTLQAYRDASSGDKPYSEIWDSGHYLIVVGIDATNIYFVDPALVGHRGFIPRAGFLERWHDGSLTIGQMQQPAILLTGKPTPSVWEEIP